MVGLLLAALSLEDLAPSTIVPYVPISFHLAQHLRPGATQKSEADPELPPGYAQRHVPNPCPLPFWGKTGRGGSGRALRGCLEPYAPRSQPQSRRRPPHRPQPRPLPHHAGSRTGPGRGCPRPAPAHPGPAPRSLPAGRGRSPSPGSFSARDSTVAMVESAVSRRAARCLLLPPAARWGM